jgi:hypothetical protein
MEVLLHCGTKIGGWRTAEIHQAILGLRPLEKVLKTIFM